MNFINDLKPTNDPLSYWGNAVKDTIRQNTLFPNSDFVSDSNFGGTSIELSSKFRYPQQPDTYKGEWNITSSYNIGDIVRVMPIKDYIWGDTGSLKSICFELNFNTENITDVDPPQNTYTPGQILIPSYPKGANEVTNPYILYIKPIPGVYRCCYTVPPMFGYSDIILNNGFINSFPKIYPLVSRLTPPSHIGPPYADAIIPNLGTLLRFWDVNYFPVWPELPTVAGYNGTDFKGFHGRYWELISLLPTYHTWTTCKHGVTKVIRYWGDEENKPTGSYLNATGSVNVATW
jgi:hypothetical protein